MKYKITDFKNTFCVFNEVVPENSTIYNWNFESKSGSLYFFSEFGMYRMSNHWGQLANSIWRLEPLEIEVSSKNKLGFAPYNSFYIINKLDKLFYIEINYQKNTVSYQHKDNPKFENNTELRNIFETYKRIKQIKNILNRSKWSLNFNSDDITILRKKICFELVTTNTKLEDIKNNIEEFLKHSK